MYTIGHGNHELDGRDAAILFGQVDMLYVGRHVGNRCRERRQHAALVSHLYPHVSEVLALDVLGPLHRELPVFLAALGNIRTATLVNHDALAGRHETSDRVTRHRSAAFRERDHHALGALDRQRLAGIVE